MYVQVYLHINLQHMQDDPVISQIMVNHLCSYILQLVVLKKILLSLKKIKKWNYSVKLTFKI